MTYGAWGRAGKALAMMFFAALVAVAPAGRAQADKVHLMAIGDSLTAGYGLLDHEGLVPQLNAWLAAAGEDVRVAGAGVSGDTTAGGLARMEWSLTDEIGGIILELGANDALRGIDPQEVRANLDAMLQIAQARGLEVLIVGIPAPGNFGTDFKAGFEAIFPDLAEVYGAELYPDFFAALGNDPAQVRALMQEDGIHPNADGVARIVGGLGPAVQALIARVRARG